MGQRRIIRGARLLPLDGRRQQRRGDVLMEGGLIAAIGGVAGLLLTWPLAAAFRSAAGTLFPIFQVSGLTMALQLVAALVVGLVAAAWPAWRMGRIDIVNGLRHVG